MEAILLTGGASRRMGVDKATMLVDGRAMADRILDELLAATDRVTVCGRAPLPGADFLPDEEEFAGPLAAIASYRPLGFRIFLASCDLPWFSRTVVEDLAARLGSHEAAIPEIDGKLQPLCGLYRRSAFDFARQVTAIGEDRVMRWVEGLEYIAVPSTDLRQPEGVRNVDTPEDLYRPASG